MDITRALLTMAKRWDPSRDWEKKQERRAEREDATRYSRTATIQSKLELEMARMGGQLQNDLQYTGSVHQAKQQGEATHAGGYFEPEVGGGYIGHIPPRGSQQGMIGSDVAFEYDYATGKYRVAQKLEDGSWALLVPEKPKSEHKPGYLNTEWLKEAHERSMQSDMVIRLQMEGSGLVLIGVQGDDYEQRHISWEAIEKAETNIIIPQIVQLEKQLNIVGQLKDRCGHKSKAA